MCTYGWGSDGLRFKKKYMESKHPVKIITAYFDTFQTLTRLEI